MNNANLSTAALTQKFENLLRDHCDGPFTLLAEKVVVLSVHVLTPPQSLPAPEVTDVVRCGGTPEGIVVTLTSMNDPGLFEARLVESFGLPPNKWGSKFQSLLDEFCGGPATASGMILIFGRDPAPSPEDLRRPTPYGQTQFHCKAQVS